MSSRMPSIGSMKKTSTLLKVKIGVFNVIAIRAPFLHYQPLPKDKYCTVDRPTKKARIFYKRIFSGLDWLEQRESPGIMSETFKLNSYMGSQLLFTKQKKIHLENISGKYYYYDTAKSCRKIFP